ncbi:MAG: SseB family protein [Ignavibacteriales bacterium]|nr:SseB family protein [Ignavibacteriales bacterium]
MSQAHSELIDRLFSEKLLVILEEDPNTNGNKIILSEYVIDEESFIPVFTSEDALEEATEEIEIEQPIWEINGVLLASLLTNEDFVVVNPGLKDQEDFTGAEIIEVMKEKITALGD